MAYHNIPTVALFDNIYVNFNFVHSCNNLEDYYSIIKGKKNVEINFDKKHIYKFYYLAFLKNTNYDIKSIFSLLHNNSINTYNEKYLAYLNKININNYYLELSTTYKKAMQEIN